jgi:uroporphyrinogen-III synthase
MPRLGVTRPLSQLKDITQRAAERGIEIVPLPVIAAQSLPFDWPTDLAPEDIDWVAFSSAVAVSSFLNRLHELGVTLNKNTRIAAVGEKTADAVELFGYSAGFIPSEAYGQALFEELAISVARSGQVVLYARAEDTNFDPAEVLAEHGVAYHSLICYRTVPRVLPKDTVEGFSGSDYILFTAPSTVRSYHEQFGPPRAKAIAIGNSTSTEMWKHGWTGFSFMAKPDINLVLEYV